MIARRKLWAVDNEVGRQASAELIGPRQVGKTTLALGEDRLVILDVIDCALVLFGNYKTVAGHTAAGMRWDGFVIENLLGAVPMGTLATYYRTSAGAEIDLLLEIPGRGKWAIDIKRGLSVRPQKGFHLACEDVQPARRLAVNGGAERYWMTKEVEVVGFVELAKELAGG